MKERVKKIDVHIHTSMWDIDLPPEKRLPNPAEIKAKYKELGIDKGILSPLISPEHRFYIQTNEEAEYLSNKYSETFYWFCNIDPRMGFNSPDYDISEMLMYYKNKGALGVGELAAHLPIDDPLMDNLFYHLAECDMPAMFHMSNQKYKDYGIIDDTNLTLLEKVMDKYPKLKLVGHSAGFWSNFAPENAKKGTEGRTIELLRKFPNLYCDLSADSGFGAMTRNPELTFKIIEEFPHKFMFGTDICRPYQTSKLAGWLDEQYENGNISYENYYNICRGNAIKLYNIGIE